MRMGDTGLLEGKYTIQMCITNIMPPKTLNQDGQINCCIDDHTQINNRYDERQRFLRR